MERTGRFRALRIGRIGQPNAHVDEHFYVVIRYPYAHCVQCLIVGCGEHVRTRKLHVRLPKLLGHYGIVLVCFVVGRLIVRRLVGNHHRRLGERLFAVGEAEQAAVAHRHRFATTTLNCFAPRVLDDPRAVDTGDYPRDTVIILRDLGNLGVIGTLVTVFAIKLYREVPAGIRVVPADDRHHMIGGEALFVRVVNPIVLRKDRLRSIGIGGVGRRVGIGRHIKSADLTGRIGVETGRNARIKGDGSAERIWAGERIGIGSLIEVNRLPFAALRIRILQTRVVVWTARIVSIVEHRHRTGVEDGLLRCVERLLLPVAIDRTVRINANEGRNLGEPLAVIKAHTRQIVVRCCGCRHGVTVISVERHVGLVRQAATRRKGC